MPKCKICGHTYKQEAQVLECEKIGIHEIIKFKPGQRVEITDRFANQEKTGIIIKFIFSPPDLISRKQTHTLIYLIKLETINNQEIKPTEKIVTTATSDELTLILELKNSDTLLK